MIDLIYFWALLAAMFNAVAGTLLCLIALRKLMAPGAMQIAFVTLVLGAVALVLAVGVHAHWGHGPASAAPQMGFVELLAAHPSFAVTAGLLVVGFVLLPRARRRQRALPEPPPPASLE